MSDSLTTRVTDALREAGHDDLADEYTDSVKSDDEPEYTFESIKAMSQAELAEHFMDPVKVDKINAVVAAGPTPAAPAPVA